jgi:signal transduction histidine kinase/CheY-like chemotaxis protein/HPt (histidine-containing phosphotransfer) domain-containing protein
MDLQKAENSIRLYTITRNPTDIKPYYTIISNIDAKVSQLRSECLNDTALLEQTDTISLLIEENIFIWNKLLLLNNDDKVTDYMKQLSDQLDSASQTSQKKEGILKRVFNRSNKSLLYEQEIMNNLNEIVEQDRTTKEKLVMQETQLAVTSSEIKEKFYDLITKMENEISDLVKAKAVSASEITESTYRWLAMIAVSGGLLAALVLYILIRYVKKAYSYQTLLERSRDETERLARTKELFMANISHEIRTPVTAISGFTGQLLHEPLSENVNRSLKIIKSSSDHLLKIIDDILDFSKLQNNKLALEKVHFSIGQILEDVYMLFEKQAERNNTRLSYSLSSETPSVLQGDPYRLKQIFINLVGNSIKFTKNGSVHYEVSSRTKENRKIDLVMEFNDTGIGIDESKLNIIFEDFTQAEMSTTRKYGGTGLGLSIVRKLVELMHGTIDVSSKKNQGTLIVCRIPFLTGDENQVRGDTAPPLSVPEEISGMRVLVVDDEEYNRLLFKKIFGRWNIECQESVNGMEALELLKTEQFDLLFMDIRMPGIDGLKTTGFIRSEMKISESEMPIVLVSAAPLNEDLQKYRDAGMSAFLRKPFTEEKLLETVVTVISDRAQGPPAEAVRRDEEKAVPEEKINLKNLYHISGGDEDFVKQMLASFINTTGKGLKEMQDAASARQWETVADLAHKILSPCRHIGAMDLYNLLNRIEKSIRNNSITEPVEALTGKSITEFEAVSDLLNEHISKLN